MSEGDDWYIPFEGSEPSSTRPLRPGEIDALKRAMARIRERQALRDARCMTAAERESMEAATKEVDAEASALLAGIKPYTRS